MVRRCSPFFLLLSVVAFLGATALADSISVGLLSYDAIGASQDQFDFTNLTGVGAFPPTYPITTQLTFTVTSLVVDFTSGPPVTLPGSDFTVVDSDKDLDCTVAGCNFFGDSITSATLTGTISPTTGLSGLPTGDTGILPGVSTTFTSSCGTTLVAGCDFTAVNATGVSSVSTVPEPSTATLCFMPIGFIVIGAVIKGWLRGRGKAADFRFSLPQNLPNNAKS